MKGSGGCWSCRARRKRCDGKQPACDTCSVLYITCHYGAERPQWMDGGLKQEEMAQTLKREVRMNAQRRRLQAAEDSRYGQATQESTAQADAPDAGQKTAACPCRPTGLSTKCPVLGQSVSPPMPLGQPDAILLMFYLDNLLPFLFPFYQPDPLKTGGKAWILEMITSSPMLRQIALCQSSYFFSLARGNTHDDDSGWHTSLEQTRDAFAILQQALSVINNSSVTGHLLGAVRILTGIIQVQRFEIAALSFGNCQAHLDAAVALFQQLLKDSGTLTAPNSRSRFATTVDALGPPPWTHGPGQVPTAEQAAFRFSSALLVYDDIIASTVFERLPRLYEYHEDILLSHGDAGHDFDLESVTGCQGWVLLRIGEISMLDAWKKECRKAGTLDVMQMVQRAESIKESLQSSLKQLPSNSTEVSTEEQHIPEVFARSHGSSIGQHTIVTRIWAHAALLYLFIVVSGWQPANTKAQYHVNQILDMLSYQLTPPALLRTVVWPFCVAGCLAQTSQHTRFRNLVDGLRPHSVFGTTREGLRIMENVWREREAMDSATFDLASCFKGRGELVLLV